jgi:Tfp pilus assembly PilM family ATPase
MSSVIGLHIDGGRINAALVSKSGRRVRLRCFVSSSADRDEAVRAVLSEILGKKEFLSGEIVASFPSRKCIIEKIELPFASPRMISRTVAFDAERALPCGAEELALDWYTLSGGTKKTSVVVVAAKKETLLDYLRLLESCGVEPTAVVPDFCALYNAVRAEGALCARSALVLHTQDDAIDLLTVENSRPSLFYSEDASGSPGADGRAALVRLSAALEAACPETAFEEVVVVGDGVPDSFYEEVQRQLNASLTRVAAPADVVAGLSAQEAEEFGRYGHVAFGLALRGLECAEIPCDLRKGELADPARFEPLKSVAAVGLMMLALLFFVLAFHLSTEASRKSAELAAIESSIEQRWKDSFIQKGDVPDAVVMRMEGLVNRIKSLSEGPESALRLRSPLGAWQKFAKAGESRQVIIEEISLEQGEGGPTLRVAALLLGTDPLAPDKFADELRSLDWVKEVSVSGSQSPAEGKVRRIFTIVLSEDNDN